MNCKTCKYSSLSWFAEPCNSCCPSHNGYEAINGKEQGVNEQLRKDIRAEIEEVKELKRSVGEINSHLNTIEQLCTFDMEALEQREKEAYRKGLDDAWHAARKIELNVLPNGELGLLGKEMKSIFGSPDVCVVFETFTASEAIEAIKAYEEKKDDEIHVGDVVVCRTSKEKGIATRVDKQGANVLLGSGHTGYYTFNLLEKTNKHNSSIEAILKRISDENN